MVNSSSMGGRLSSPSSSSSSSAHASSNSVAASADMQTRSPPAALTHSPAPSLSSSWQSYPRLHITQSRGSGPSQHSQGPSHSSEKSSGHSKSSSLRSKASSTLMRNVPSSSLSLPPSSSFSSGIMPLNELRSSSSTSSGSTASAIGIHCHGSTTKTNNLEALHHVLSIARSRLTLKSCGFARPFLLLPSGHNGTEQPFA
mmetsp:Transcript_30062/g.70072  ORF Transcript_30062/g.70072 Transcript_30062/m.70072 type:complete len:200 (+) Transcript_30062:99-698(+)